MSMEKDNVYLGVSSSVGHESSVTAKYNMLLNMLGTEFMLKSFEVFLNSKEISEIVACIEEELKDLEVPLPY